VWLGASRAPALLGLLALTAFQMAQLAPELRLAPFPLNDDACTWPPRSKRATDLVVR
jgi:hypothetical protein